MLSTSSTAIVLVRNSSSGADKSVASMLNVTLPRSLGGTICFVVVPMSRCCVVPEPSTHISEVCWLVGLPSAVSCKPTVQICTSETLEGTVIVVRKLVYSSPFSS